MSKGAKRNAIQWLYGETNEVELPVKTTKTNECEEIAVGDPVYFNMSTLTGSDKNYAYPIGKLASASVGDRANAMFAGISMSVSQDGESKAIRVAQTGVFEIPLSGAATVRAGDFAKPVTGVGASSGSLDVDAITTAAPTGEYVQAIGTVVEGGTTVSVAKVKIQSRLLAVASLDTTRAVAI